MGAPEVVGIDLDRRRTLRYTYAACIEAEERLGGESLQRTIAELGARRLAVYLWAGLRHEEEGLTVPRVAQLMDKSGLGYPRLWEKVLEGLRKSGILKTEETDAAGPLTG